MAGCVDSLFMATLVMPLLDKENIPVLLLFMGERVSHIRLHLFEFCSKN